MAQLGLLQVLGVSMVEDGVGVHEVTIAVVLIHVLQSRTLGVVEHVIAGTPQTVEGQVLHHHDGTRRGYAVRHGAFGEGVEGSLPVIAVDGIGHGYLDVEVLVTVPAVVDEGGGTAQQQHEEQGGSASPCLVGPEGLGNPAHDQEGQEAKSQQVVGTAIDAEVGISIAEAGHARPVDLVEEGLLIHRVVGQTGYVPKERHGKDHGETQEEGAQPGTLAGDAGRAGGKGREEHGGKGPCTHDLVAIPGEGHKPQAAQQGAPQGRKQTADLVAH